MKWSKVKYLFFLSIFFYACKSTEYTTKGIQIIKIKNAPPKVPYLYHNTFTLVDDKKLSELEKQIILGRLKAQLDDSSVVNKVDNFFFLGTIKKPTAYDTAYSRLSATNMRTSMYPLGYYNAVDSFSQDTIKRRVTVNYFIKPNKPTLIDTVSYSLKLTDLNELTQASLNKTALLQNEPVTKAAIQSELSRLVDTFNNNGYYKFSAAELRVLGDSSIEALTSLSDDPFEQLQLLEEAQKKRDSPSLRLAIILNKPDDSTKLTKYFINKIYVLSDYRPNDLLSDTITTATYTLPNFIERYHQPIFKSSLLSRNITLRSGQMFRQQDYLNTLANLTKLQVWQSINIRLVENIDYADKVDIIIELIPDKKYSYLSTVEASYAATSNAVNALGGSLFGFSINVGITNKNFAREAVRMAHNLRFGIELNNANRNNINNPINSNDISYANNTTIPRRFLAPLLNKLALPKGESFVNAGISYSNRINLFTLQSVNVGVGVNASNSKGKKLIIKPINIEYSLLNKTDSFNKLIAINPFLRYSYNTTFILGPSISYLWSQQKRLHPRSVSNLRVARVNIEESGSIATLVGLLKNVSSSYVKLDAEFKQTISYKRDKQIALRFFAGIGVPLRGDSSLPFFKQFFGGGSNSMRGWPVRGIGRGREKLVPLLQNIFNDRTGDFQFETNIELRHQIVTFIPDLFKLKGAVIMDIGNVWNIKAPLNTAGTDLSKFQLKNFYRELGMSAGYGLRIDFSNLIIRGDFSFRFKRPETSNINNGWKLPSIGFNDVLQKVFSSSQSARNWRYENFNFTLGINYPF